MISKKRAMRISHFSKCFKFPTHFGKKANIRNSHVAFSLEFECHSIAMRIRWKTVPKFIIRLNSYHLRHVREAGDLQTLFVQVIFVKCAV